MKKEDLEQIMFLEQLKGESLENVIDYWACANYKNLGGYFFTVTENPIIYKAISDILKVLNNERKTENKAKEVSIKELLNKKQ